MHERHDYRELYRETIPSVVSVYVAAGANRAAGSGFVYDDEHVLTNHHVVGDAAEVDLRFAEGEWRTGEVVGTDPYTDLAVVAVADLPADADPLPMAEAPADPGTPVAALGNPMGLDGSISTGIVSGAARSMPSGNGFSVPDVVQTDAPINPGNSGGPLVAWEVADESTEAEEPQVRVVGVNRARAGDNIGFAVSADVVERVVPGLVAEGEFRHSYLKVRTLDVSPTVAAANGLEDHRGVLVVDVARGPASGVLLGCTGTVEHRGREVPVGGDVIVAVDGEAVDSHEALMGHLLLETRPGEAVSVEVIRDGREVTERLTLAERPTVDVGTRRRRRERRPRRRRDVPVR